MLDYLHLDVGSCAPLNIYLLWGLDGGNYLLVDGGVIALTVTINMLAHLTYQLGNRGELTKLCPCHGRNPLIAR